LLFVSRFAKRPAVRLRSAGATSTTSRARPATGGATTTLVVNRVIHDLTFVELKPDGNALFDTTVQPPVPRAGAVYSG
jgi:hypothetical protein